ncbi:MAG: hypothetical protein AAF211_30530, partial [Myxococcota bacterium]
GVMERTCWPVSKDNLAPTPSQLDFIEYVDLACYDATTPHNPQQGTNVTLEHLNPLYANVAPHGRTLKELESLCFPVAKKGGVTPPPAVDQFIRYFDLACYRTTKNVLPDTLTLDHLNPLLVGAPSRDVRLDDSTQVCVPIEKLGAPPPQAIRDALAWPILAPYDLTYLNFNSFASLGLVQLNPLFAGAPQVRPRFRPTNRPQLMLPMMLNGNPPPGGGNGPGCPPVVPDCIDFDALPLGPIAIGGLVLPTFIEGIPVALGSPTVGGVILNPPSPFAAIDDAWFTNPGPGADRSITVDPGVLVFDFSGVCPERVTFDYRYEDLTFTPNISVNGSAPLTNWFGGTGVGTPAVDYTVGIPGPGIGTGVGSGDITAPAGSWIDEVVLGGDFMRFDSICWE